MINMPSPPKLNHTSYNNILDARSKSLNPLNYSYKLQQGYGIDTFLSGNLQINENEMSVILPFASGERRDGVGDLVEISGIQTERHKKNPIVLWDHGRHVSLPIGISEDPITGEYGVVLDTENQRALGKCWFYRGKGLKNTNREDEYEHALFCMQLWDLVVQKIIRGSSVGYQIVKAFPLQADPLRGIPAGLRLIEILMLEFSLTGLPANSDTVIGGKSFPTIQAYDSWVENIRRTLSVKKLCGKPISGILVKSLSACVPEDTRVITGYEGKSITSDKNSEVTALEDTSMKSLRKKYKKTLSYTPERLRENSKPEPYKPPKKVNKERQYQQELGDKISSNPQNLLASDESVDPGHTTSEAFGSWAKIKELRKKYKKSTSNKKDMSAIGELNGGSLVAPAKQEDTSEEDKKKRKIKSLRIKYHKKSIDINDAQGGSINETPFHK